MYKQQRSTTERYPLRCEFLGDVAEETVREERGSLVVICQRQESHRDWWWRYWQRLHRYFSQTGPCWFVT